jgi:hypothetical protein
MVEEMASYFQFPSLTSLLHLATFPSTIVSPIWLNRKFYYNEKVIGKGELSQQLQFQGFVAESGNTTLKNTTRST